MKIQSVFEHMNRRKVHLGIVKNDTSLIVGIVTLEDIVEEIVGKINDEHDQEYDPLNEEIESDLDTGIVVNGTISLRDLYNEHDINIPLNDNYSTLTGFLLAMLGDRFPEEGQIIIWERMSFQISLVQKQEISEVRISNINRKSCEV